MGVGSNGRTMFLSKTEVKPVVRMSFRWGGGGVQRRTMFPGKTEVKPVCMVCRPGVGKTGVLFDWSVGKIRVLYDWLVG